MLFLIMRNSKVTVVSTPPPPYFWGGGEIPKYIPKNTHIFLENTQDKFKNELNLSPFLTATFSIKQKSTLYQDMP